MTATGATILCTAFEPSGDHHGAALIRSLLRERPDLRIVALGGPLMQQAGATLLETTTEKAVMLHGAAAQIMAHRARVKRLRQWLADHTIDMLIPVDSPAANWSICKAVRQTQPAARIVHLVAPQLWAWAPWRIRRMRRLSDHVLCLLPFEPDWFKSRHMPATFVGHPMFERHLRFGAAPQPQSDQVSSQAGGAEETLPESELKLALLPGSRPGEIAKNWPTMQAVFNALKQRHGSRLSGVVAAREVVAAGQIESLSKQAGGWSEDLQLVTGCTPKVLRWADVVLVVSGTASLQVASVHKPMVVLFNISRWVWHLFGRWLIQTRTFALPNLVRQWQCGRHAVPELVPHFGQVLPVVQQVDRLLTDQSARSQIKAELQAVCEPFEGVDFEQAAAEAVLAQLTVGLPRA